MNYRTLSHHLVGITALLLLSQQSYAASCKFASGSSVRNFSATIKTSVAVPRDAPKGSIGNPIQVTSGGTPTTVICEWGSDNKVYNMFKLPSPGSATSTSGVYQTNVPGIGYIISVTIFSGSNLYTVTNSLNWLSYIDKAATTNPTTTQVVQIYSVSVQFYVTGPVTPGNVTFNAPTLSAFMGPTNGSEVGAVNYSNFTINGSVPVTVLACETPDISVDLKKHDSAEFPNVGSTSAATNFNFAIKNCPANLNSVNYTFKPASGITLKGSGTGQYLTLDSSSSASGVGVQVLYSDGTNVPFNKKTSYTGYSTSTGGSYTIPMKARYIRTGTIKGGTANSALEFDMAYE